MRFFEISKTKKMEREMEIFLDYMWVFLIGGLVCAFGELLIITTNITSARILVTFVLIGVVLEAVGLFD